MPQRKCSAAYKRKLVFLQDRTLDMQACDGVWAVQYQNRNFAAAAAFIAFFIVEGYV